MTQSPRKQFDTTDDLIKRLEERTFHQFSIDVESLQKELKEMLFGEVRFDAGSRAIYATDASNYRQVPIGVVIPKTKEDVIKTLRLANKYDTPILSRGGGTSLAGQCCNVALVIDFSKYMNQILEINSEKMYARVQPGVVLDQLRNEAQKYGLTFGPDPATHSHCTLGGMIGNNSCGVHALMAGKTVDNVIELEVLTYDGLRMTVGELSESELAKVVLESGEQNDVYRKLKTLRDRYVSLIRQHYPNIPRRVSGYNLDDLLPENGFHVAKTLVGTECTCVTILEAKVRLIRNPKAKALVVLGYPSVYEAGDHVTDVLNENPIGLEGIDDNLIQYAQKKNLNAENLNLLPEGRGWLLCEFGGETKKEAHEKVKLMMSALQKKDKPPTMKFFEDEEEAKRIWQIRESGLGATARVPGMKDTWPGWEDSAIPPNQVGAYLRDFRQLLEKYNYDCALYGHFGQGCIHVRIDFDLNSANGIKKYRSFVEEAADLVMNYSGSLSGEHGDGQSRAELLVKMYGSELVQAFREFKRIWDPKNKMNPGKVVDAYQLDENLKLGVNYRPWNPKTHFKFPDDKGSLPYASLRCVGVGKCRREHSGIMCPSYMTTKEEMHCTRGRARMLFELFQGDPLTKKWREEEFKKALDLCLACKGCKGECPVQVDMATYKAEFLSHYYQWRFRPRSAYSMGLIHWWSQIAIQMPKLFNLFTQNKLTGYVAKKISGIAIKRKIPRYASESFRTVFFKTHKNEMHQKEQKGRVLLWVDTFNNYFHPEVAQAATEVLESFGYDIAVTEKNLCCGRPLYDYGMLHLAKFQLKQILNQLKMEIRQGIPLVGLEPSCISVFRDELINFFPNDQDAIRLSQQSFLLSEFLDDQNIKLPQIQRKAIVHSHCHHKSILNFDKEISVLKKMGLDYEVLDSGCCGMAGAFGFEKEHYEISEKCGERVLMPKVKQACSDELIVANGFSCREQIHQMANRRSYHLAEVLHMAVQKSKQRVSMNF